MLNVLIVDDQPLCRKIISDFIERNFNNVKIIGESDSISLGLDIIRQNRIDVLFLNINLDIISDTGLDLFKQFSFIPFDLIITSETGKYALKAFDYDALDYLLKPINPDRLKEAMIKIFKKKNQQLNQMESLIQNIIQTDSFNKKIGLCDKYELIFTKISDIYYCKAEGVYTRFFLKDGKPILVSKNIKEYELLLPRHYFFRAHKSYLINLNEINKYVKADGGYVVMQDGNSVPLSSRRKEDFLKSIMDFHERRL